MGKFGLGSKKNDGDSESGRSSLFSRSKTKSPMPETNPYAQTSSNPYAQAPSVADPYQQAKFNVGVGGYDKSSNSYPSEKSAGTASQYTGGYGAGRFGNQAGYSGDRYGGQTQPEERSSRPGGYGGLGDASAPYSATDKNREALFAKKESSDFRHQSGGPPAYDGDQSQGGRPGGYGGGSEDYGGSSTYEAYGDRQLTAEEEEEEEVTAAKDEIRFLKQQDVSSTRNALRAAAMAEEQGRGTLARLGAQGERIHNTEKNLDLTASHNRLAEDKAKELKKLNGSMFAIHPSNPFTASKRREQRDADILEKHQMERAAREATRKEAYDSDKRLETTFKGLNVTDNQAKANKSLAERSKYQFEADSEDEEMENEIDSNLDQLSSAAGRLNTLAKATGKELDEQNRHLERINQKSTAVDDHIAMNRARLDRFK